MRLSRRILALGVLAAAVPAGGLTTTTAGFTDSATASSNSVTMGALTAPELRGGADDGAVSLSWDPPSEGGADPQYTLTRTSTTDPDPVTIMQGPGTSSTDPGNLPQELRTRSISILAAGTSHSVAVVDDGTVWTWGRNNDGQLGDGTLDSTDVPVPVDGLPEGRAIASIDAGFAHSVAAADDGTVWSWGDNSQGQLGDGTYTDRSTPVSVKLPEGTFIRTVSAGSLFTLAVADDGTAWAWGNNGFGQLGDGTEGTTSLPVHVISPPDGSAITDVAAGEYHSLALTSNGAVWAWGDNQTGALGNGSSGLPSPTPTKVVSTGRPVTAISGGDGHSLARDETGALWAWGNNDHGQLGDGTRTLSTVPVHVTSLPGDRFPTAVSAAGYRSLALADDGTAWAWGDNSSAQLGDGTNIDRSTPVPVLPLAQSRSAAMIAAGPYHSLVAAADGTGWGFGYGGAGQLGNGGTASAAAPTMVVPIEVEQCPPGSTAIANTSLCSLIAGAEYSYELNVAVGGWTAGPSRFSIVAQ